MHTFDDIERRRLLRRARLAIARAAGAECGHPADEPADRVRSPMENLRAGVFVTLRVRGTLRGCIGYPDPGLALADAVERCAVSAAMCDPRFPALTVAGLPEVDLEISVLGSIEPVGDLSDILIGRHGLIVELGRRRGLLLPQVAVEWKWTAPEFAAQTCLKAGLHRDAWQDGARLFRFEAEVFGEPADIPDRP